MRFTAIIFILMGSIFNAQSVYKAIPQKKITVEKIELTKNFAKEFIRKCAEKNYSMFTDYKLTNNLNEKIEKSLIKICEQNHKSSGKITVGDFNSAYIDRYTNLYNPIELYIFNGSSGSNNNIKYISVWITKNDSLIDGIWMSQEKPLIKK